MVVRLLGRKRDAGHEGEGFPEVAEAEASRNAAAGFVEAPALECGERRLPFVPAQHRHDWLLPLHAFMSPQMSERQTFAPDAAALERLGEEAIRRLPAPFRAHLTDVVLRVEEFADDDVLADLGIEDPFDLTGLYSGRPLSEQSSMTSGELPPMIHLYRRPLLDEWVDTGVSLEALITHVIVHEVGHHFGFSDEDMHAIEDEAG